MQRGLRNTGQFEIESFNLEWPTGCLTRRQLLNGMAVVGLGSLATSLVPANAESNVETSIREDIAFKVAPPRVYEALLDERQFSAFTGGSAQISREVGGEFKLFGGLQGIKGVTGRNIELVPNKRIVQAWRANLWPVGVYSIVRFELFAEGAGTRLSFEQAALGPIPPPGAWNHMYWAPLKNYLNG